MMSFAERFVHLSQRRSPLCLGLDPSEELFRIWGLSNDLDGLRSFCRKVLEAAEDNIAVIKPQAGFFERFGPKGVVELADANIQIRDRGALCLVDAKRGDVSETMEGYATALVGPGNAFGCDAVTLNPFLGLAALQPALNRAIASRGGVFVVVHSSNADGRALQSARHQDGRMVSEALADEITAFNTDREPEVGAIGAVIGATIETAATPLIERLPRSLILVPGVGAQGAQMDDVGRKFQAARGRVLPSVSRSILRRGPDLGALREAMKRYREAAWLACS